MVHQIDWRRMRLQLSISLVAGPLSLVYTVISSLAFFKELL
jgi:hypothetical protein